MSIRHIFSFVSGYKSAARVLKHFNRVKIMILAILILPFTASAQFSGGGTGVVTDPYTIATPEQLVELATLVNAGNADYYDKHYKLVSDIDLSAYGEDYNNGAGWTPIASNQIATARFSGVFDGDGHIITGLYINNTTLAYAGLFGFNSAGSVVKNLEVKDAEITSTAAVATTYTGGIIGYCANSTISNCRFTGTITASATTTVYAGGITGMNTTATGSLSNCWFSGDITASANTNAYLGGIIGDLSSAILSNCYSTGSVTSTGTNNIYCGAIAGRNNGGSALNCWSSVGVTSIANTTGYGGGIAGFNTGANAKIINCAALNPYINVGGNTRNIGRVTGLNTQGTLTNNIALSNMVKLPTGVAWSNIGDDQIDGADITVSAILADGTLGNRFTTPDWTVDNGKLPGLGSAVTPPSYLTGSKLVLSVLVEPNILLMRKGETHTFIPRVLGFNLTEAVTWSLEGGNAGTTLTNGGLLTVDSNELSLVLKVTVTSVEDNTKSAIAMVDINIYDGDGTEQSPYIITYSLQLAQLATYTNDINTNFNNKYYKLANDLDLSDYGEDFNNGEGWIPIGTTSTARFFGHFNGDGHIITGLFINNTTFPYSALFGSTGAGSSIKNVGVSGAKITSKPDAATVTTGGIVGACTSPIENCWFSGEITSTALTSPGNSYVGGVVGSGGVSISNCYSMGSVTSYGVSNSYAGGIIGNNAANGNVSKCWSIMEIYSNASTTAYSGGIIAYNSTATSTVSNCVALNPTINVNGSSKYIGRVTGQKNASSTTTNNFAWNNMINLSTGVWNNIGANMIDGADITVAEIIADGTFGDIFTSPVWTTENGKLPGFGAPIVPPAYLTDGPYVYAINISPNGATIKKGDTETFTVNILGFNLITKTVTWSVEGANSTGTTITSGGLLTVAIDETSAKLVVKATSTEDTFASTLAIIIIVEAGSGTEADPAIITTAEQLAIIAEATNMGALGAKHYKLGNNIDLSEYGENYINNNKDKGWLPIGNTTFPFTSVLDGDNNVITGIYINSTLANAGLFGVCVGTIKNLGIVDVKIYSNSDNKVGTIAGSTYYLSGNVTLTGNVLNCYATGDLLVLGNNDIGGLIGQNSGIIENCYFIGTISATITNPSLNSCIGGLVGNNMSRISRCYFIGTVNGAYIAGGIAGYNGSGGCVTEYCYSMGAVNVINETMATYGGGIVGASNGIVRSCWSTAEIRGFAATGMWRTLVSGIGGQLGSSVSNCVALNTIIHAFPGSYQVSPGRISGLVNGTRSNNVAFENMINQSGTTTWDNKGLTNQDGADITLQEINEDGTLGGRFTPENGWTIVNGKLPGLFGNTVDMPAHLFLPEDIYSVSGKITGTNHLGGIEGARVTLSCSGFPTCTAITDVNGEYFIENAYDTKSYTVKVEAAGYVPHISTITVAGDDFEDYDISLNEILFPICNVEAEANGNVSALITWDEPGTSSIFRHDSGVCSGNGGGISSRLGVVGSVHRYGVTLNKISWFLIEERPAVDIFVFGLNESGIPNNYNLIFTKQDIPNTSMQWCEYELPLPLYLPDGFFIGISVSNNQNTALGLDVPNDEYPFLQNTHFYNQRYTTERFVPLENSGNFANLMIRGEGVLLKNSIRNYELGMENSIKNEELRIKRVEEDEISEISPLNSHLSPLTSNSQFSILNSQFNKPFNSQFSILNSQFSSRSVSSYKVYLLEEGYPEENWLLLDGNVTGTTYTDNTIWPTLSQGTYQYAVKAVYPGDIETTAGISSVLGRGMEVNYQVNITTNTGVSATGAIVTIKHQDGNPNHVYTKELVTENVIFEDIWRGTYDLTIKHLTFNTYNAVVNTEGGLFHNATLLEAPYQVSFVNAEIVDNKAVVKWGEPSATRKYVLDDGEPENGWSINPNSAAGLGNMFVVNESGLIKSVDVYSVTNSNNTDRTVYIRIYNQNKQLVGESEGFTMVGESWINVPLNDVEYSETFYAFVWWQGTSGYSHTLGYDYHGALGADLSHNAYINSSGVISSPFNIIPNPVEKPGVFMIRVNSELTAGKTVNYGVDSKAITGYNVYRLLQGQEENEDAWTQVATNVSELTYTDANWSSLNMGIYRYAVKAKYTYDVSKAFVSNVLFKDMFTDFQINITTNSGHPATGAKVKLTNQDGNPTHVYEQKSGTDGVLFNDVWKGTYNLTVTLPGYTPYSHAGLSIMTLGSYPAQLLDIIYPVSEVTAKKENNNALITWVEPSMGKKSYILDDGTSEGGLAINPETSQYLGNIFNVEDSGELTSIELYGRTNTNAGQTRKVTIEIFDADFELLGQSEPFLIPANAWITVPLDNIPFSGNFYVMVKWPDMEGSTNFLSYDSNGPNATLDYSMFSADGKTVRTLRSAASQYICVFMIRANAYVTGKGSIRNYELGIKRNEDEISDSKPLISHSSPLIPESDSRAVISYTVYRLLQGQPETSWTELSNNVTTLEYTDTDWNTLAEGAYQYAVKAKFGSGFSEAVLSNTLNKVFHTVTVIAEEGGKVEIVGQTGTSAQIEGGKSVTVKATANENYRFDNWKDGNNTVSSSAEYTFTVNKNTTLTANFSLVGIKENEISGFTIYPNPATSELRIENGELKMERINIYNAVGQVVMEVSNVNSTSYKLNVEMLSSGVYFISVQTKFGVIKSKFVKK